MRYSFLALCVAKSVVATAFVFVSACSPAGNTSIPALTPNRAQVGEGRFVISLYESIDIDPEPSGQGNQEGLDGAELGKPTNVFSDHELVGVDWDEKILEYDSRVRETYGDDTAVFIPSLDFVIEYDGVRILAGAVIEEGNAAVIKFPVLEYFPLEECAGGRVVFRLRPNHWGEISAVLPGLTPELNEEIGAYLGGRSLECASR